MKSLVRTLLAALAALQIAAASAADTIRIAAQKTGTFAWELAIIRAHGLDKEANLALEVRELASPEAGKIALRSGDAEIMISDWLWVSRERSLGAKLAFYPYSSALGAVMVPNTSPIKTLGDLKGRTRELLRMGAVAVPVQRVDTRRRSDSSPSTAIGSCGVASGDAAVPLAWVSSPARRGPATRGGRVRTGTRHRG